jgi:predicted ATPase
LSKKIILREWFTRPKDTFFLRAESFYNLASNIDKLEKESWGKMLLSYWWKSLHKQSHWESFLSLFINRFFWNWIYILDEPESALSPQNQLAFLARLDDLVKQNSQFIIVTHSPIILSYPNSKIIEITKDWFFELQYKDTNHYNLYKTFLDNPGYMLNKLNIK